MVLVSSLARMLAHHAPSSASCITSRHILHAAAPRTLSLAPHVTRDYGSISARSQPVCSQRHDQLACMASPSARWSQSAAPWAQAGSAQDLWCRSALHRRHLWTTAGALGSSDSGGDQQRTPTPSSSSSSSLSSSSEDLQGLSSPSDAPPMIISPVPCRVVVIGWMGSRKRYLQKYSQLWLRSGDHEVLVLRPTIPMTLLRWKGVVTAGKDIDKVARMHIENPNMPTIYHIFSTGGFIHAGTMWQWMDEVEDVVMRRDLLEEVKGIIFDSGPSRVNQDIASTAIASALLGVPAEDVAAGRSAAGAQLAGVAKAALGWYLQRPSVKQREKEVFEAWYEVAPTCPQLYLYSDADPLVQPSEVERYMKIQESRGVEVSSYKWADSGHCEHYRRHPHEYAFQISQFMARALKDV